MQAGARILGAIGCAIGQSAEDVDGFLVRSFVLSYRNKRFVQVLIAAVSDNRVEIRLVAIVVAAAYAVVVAYARNRLGFVLVGRAVVVIVTVRVGIRVCVVGQAQAYEAKGPDRGAAEDEGQDA